MEELIPAGQSELIGRGYSEEEVAHIYELGRLSLENGQLRSAKVIMSGLNEVAPDYAPAWLAMSYVFIVENDFDKAVFSARQALRINPSLTEATLYLAACLISTGELAS